MNLQNWENRGSSLQYTGWISERISLRLPVAGEVFFLDIPLYRTRLPEKSFQNHLYDYPTVVRENDIGRKELKNQRHPVPRQN